MKKSIVVLLAVVFLFSTTYSVMAAASADSNSPKAVCPKAKGECPKAKAACDKKDAPPVCTKEKKKCEDHNKPAGKKA
ncbi:MAG: hypothetical protein Q7T18_12400 [Sedimentisphaerales bacterium]|nr:hypothetical protein [Sedimentisphaerales bacterium]